MNAIVSSKGQVTLPAAARAQLGLEPGTHITFDIRAGELVIRPELPIESYFGVLKNVAHLTSELPKEPDRAL